MTVTIESGGPLPASLDGLKAYLRISTADEDALLTDLIRAAGDSWASCSSSAAWRN
jgi:hypothetical protein